MKAEIEPLGGSESSKEDSVEYSNAGLLYAVDEAPAWYISIALGLQKLRSDREYLIALDFVKVKAGSEGEGIVIEKIPVTQTKHYLVVIISSIGLPLILAPKLCIANDAEGNVVRALLISCLIFHSGICTLLQATFGVRLAIIQGAAISYLPPALAILSFPHNQCPDPLPQNITNSSVTLYNDTDGSIVDGNELWMRRMREVQGSIAVASCVEILFGFTGAIGFLLRFVGPLTASITVTLIGLDLFSVTYQYASVQWGIAMFTVFVMAICSQLLKNVKVPMPSYSRTEKCHVTRTPIFQLLPVTIAVVLAWTLCWIFTETNVFPNDPRHSYYKIRTDIRSDVIHHSPWFKVPYPGQWGLPSASFAGTIGMIGGVMAGLLESLADYYTCARITGAPNPPHHAMNRGILVEGLGCMMGGLLGTGCGVTSFSQNIGVIGITGVGSRRVVQVAGVLMMLFGVFCKFGSIFVTVPDPVLGGIFCVMFGMITSVGISNLQFVNLNSPRNLFIIGVSLLLGLTISQWMKANPGIIQSGFALLDQILTVLMETSMLVGGLLATVFDNLLPGTDAERGLVAWRKAQSGIEIEDERLLNERLATCYSLPFPTNFCRFSRFLPFLPEYQKDKAVQDHNEEIEL